MIWEDKTALYTVQEPHAKHEKGKLIEYRGSLQEMDPSRIVELIRDSLLDENGVREFWQSLDK